MRESVRIVVCWFYGAGAWDDLTIWLSMISSRSSFISLRKSIYSRSAFALFHSLTLTLISCFSLVSSYTADDFSIIVVSIYSTIGTATGAAYDCANLALSSAAAVFDLSTYTICSYSAIFFCMVCILPVSYHLGTGLLLSLSHSFCSELI